MSIRYVKSVDHMSEEQKRLYEAKNFAVAQDTLAEGMLKVPLWKCLSRYSDPRFAQENVYFVDVHGQKTSILCERGSLREASLCFTGLIWQLGCMPFLNFRDVLRPEPWAPQGAQHVIFNTLGLPEGDDVRAAFDVIHVMAGLRVRQGGLRDLRAFEVHGEESICLSLPFSTHPDHVMQHERIVTLPEVLDPRGIATAYAQRRGNVITNRNMLDVLLAEPTQEAGKYELDDASPEILRQGQIARVELVFRIVPSGNDFTLRADIKSIIIINTKIAENIAFAENMERRAKQNKRGTFSIGGPGPSGTVIVPSSTSAKTGEDVSMKEAPAPVVIESASRFEAGSSTGKGKGKVVAIGQLPFESTGRNA